jgi:hypothetical protein
MEYAIVFTIDIKHSSRSPDVKLEHHFDALKYDLDP